MIALSNSVEQVLTPGQTLTFDKVLLHTGCGECHRVNSGAVKLRANGIYMVHFSGNIARGTTDAPVQLSIALGGEVLPESTMVVTSSTAAAYNNVAKTLPVKNCCGDYDRVTIVNNGTQNVAVAANTILFIKRDA